MYLYDQQTNKTIKITKINVKKSHHNYSTTQFVTQFVDYFLCCCCYPLVTNKMIEAEGLKTRLNKGKIIQTKVYPQLNPAAL